MVDAPGGHCYMPAPCPDTIPEFVQTAKAAVATCGAEGDMREAARDRVIKSLDEIIETNAALKAQTE